MSIDVALYCPNCGDRVPREPLSIDIQELLHCIACFHSFTGGELMTDKRRTFLDHLVALSQPSPTEAER